MNIAVLLTTFNRREKTITCLEAVKKQKLGADVHLTVYLTDDASKDGTVEAVAAAYPDVRLFHGDGSNFWAGGMRISWREARKDDPDFYFMLNDDTLLFEDTMSRLIDIYKEAIAKYNKPVVVVGSTQDSDGNISYGGRILKSRKRVNSAVLVEGNKTITEIDLGNGNIMFIPREVEKKLGMLSDEYIQQIADFDYTMRAKEAGFPPVLAPGVLGICENDHPKNWKTGKSTLKQRIAYLHHPKGLTFKQYMYFIKRHFPSQYREMYAKLWLKTLFPVIWDRFKNEA